MKNIKKLLSALLILSTSVFSAYSYVDLVTAVKINDENSMRYMLEKDFFDQETANQAIEAIIANLMRETIEVESYFRAYTLSELLGNRQIRGFIIPNKVEIILTRALRDSTISTRNTSLIFEGFLKSHAMRQLFRNNEIPIGKIKALIQTPNEKNDAIRQILKKYLPTLMEPEQAGSPREQQEALVRTRPAIFPLPAATGAAAPLPEPVPPAEPLVDTQLLIDLIKTGDLGTINQILQTNSFDQESANRAFEAAAANLTYVGNPATLKKSLESEKILKNLKAEVIKKVLEDAYADTGVSEKNLDELFAIILLEKLASQPYQYIDGGWGLGMRNKHMDKPRYEAIKYTIRIVFEGY